MPKRTSRDDDYFEWDGGYLLGHHYNSPHPFDLTDEEAERVMKDIHEAEARRIPLGFQLPDLVDTGGKKNL